MDEAASQPEMALPTEVLEIIAYHFVGLFNDLRSTKLMYMKGTGKQTISIIPLLTSCKLIKDMVVPQLYNHVVLHNYSSYKSFLVRPKLNSYPRVVSLSFTFDAGMNLLLDKSRAMEEAHALKGLEKRLGGLYEMEDREAAPQEPPVVIASGVVPHGAGVLAQLCNIRSSFWAPPSADQPIPVLHIRGADALANIYKTGNNVQPRIETLKYTAELPTWENQGDKRWLRELRLPASLLQGYLASQPQGGIEEAIFEVEGAPHMFCDRHADWAETHNPLGFHLFKACPGDCSVPDSELGSTVRTMMARGNFLSGGEIADRSLVPLMVGNIDAWAKWSSNSSKESIEVDPLSWALQNMAM